MSLEIERGYFTARQRIYYIARWALLVTVFSIFSACIGGLYCAHRMISQ